MLQGVGWGVQFLDNKALHNTWMTPYAVLLCSNVGVNLFFSASCERQESGKC